MKTKVASGLLLGVLVFLPAERWTAAGLLALSGIGRRVSCLFEASECASADPDVAGRSRTRRGALYGALAMGGG